MRTRFTVILQELVCFRFFTYLRGLICTTRANQSAAEPVGKRLRFKRHKGMLREREGLSAVDVLAVSISFDAFARPFLLPQELTSVRRRFVEFRNKRE